MSLSTKGKFYEIDHHNGPQLFTKNGVNVHKPKQLNVDCVHRISSIINDDTTFPINLRFIAKHSSGLMQNAIIPGESTSDFKAIRVLKKCRFPLTSRKHQNHKGVRWELCHRVSHRRSWILQSTALGEALSRARNEVHQMHFRIWEREVYVLEPERSESVEVLSVQLW